MNAKTKRLHRSATDSMITGVAGGMAEHFDIDPTVIRVAWALLILASAGLALLVYVILAIVMPRQTFQSTTEGDSQMSQSEGGQNGRRGAVLAGLILIVIGALFLLSNLGLLGWWRWDVFWPLILIGVGVALLAGRLLGRGNG